MVHIVKPLPDTIIEYVWDFGILSETDIRKYVEAMLKNAHLQDQELFLDLICHSQKYFQTREDKSSVSLRDVARFIILYQWFIKTLHDKITEEPDQRYLDNLKKYNLVINTDIEDTELKAGILALCHCYYLRIAS